MLPQIALAFDRSERFKDADGRLHVRVSNLSKATVNPYRGNEIPNWEALGLEANRIYQMFRPPEELERAVATFNNIPLMSRHIVVSAADPHERHIAGSTGTDAAFVAPYLQNSLVIWRQEDIDDVEARTKCQLSCAYRYDAVMTPGTYQGLRYDGKMANIVGNHVALVEEGRAGPDVLVHDSKEGYVMADNKRAEDEDLEGMDAAEREDEEEARKKDAEDGMSEEDCNKAKDARKRARDAKKAKDAKRAKDAKEVEDRRAKDKKAKDESEEKEEKEEEREEEGEDRRRAKDKKAKDGKAMDMALDAAIAKATRDTEARVIARMTAVAQAREDVRPIIGAVSVAMDSAPAIYKLALDHLGVDLNGVPESAFAAVLKAIPKQAPASRDTIAMDHAAAAGLTAKFPALANLRH